MPLYKRGKQIARFTPQKPVERHFHDYDEIWVMLSGSARATLIPPGQEPQELLLEPGDVWMIGVGEEHDATPITDEFTIVVFPGTVPEGARRGHLYKERERYEPAFELVKGPWPATAAQFGLAASSVVDRTRT